MLRFLFDDYKNSYDTLLMKAKKHTMRVQRLRYLCAEIYRTVNGLNPSYMKMSLKNQILGRNEYNTKIISLCPDQWLRICTKSLTSLGPKIWNSLAINITSAETFEVFKKVIKTWHGEMCKCRMCTYNKNHCCENKQPKNRS